jgi:hypothetical protein
MHKVRSILVLFFLSLMHAGVAPAQWVQTNGPYGGMINSLAVSGTNLFAVIPGTPYLFLRPFALGGMGQVHNWELFGEVPRTD